ARELLHRDAVDEHFARLRRQQPQHGLEQGGLPGTIGSQQTHNLATINLKVDVAADAPGAIAKPQSMGGEHGHAHDQPSRPRASNNKKKGAPMKAVRMPIGTSMRAIVRAKVSTNKR